MREGSTDRIAHRCKAEAGPFEHYRVALDDGGNATKVDNRHGQHLGADKAFASHLGQITRTPVSFDLRKGGTATTHRAALED